MTRGRIRARPEGTLAKRSGARTCDREHVKDPSFATKKSPSECLSFNSCGGRIRTCDLQVMSLASYQLLHSAMLFLLDFQGFSWKALQRYEDFSNYANIYAVFLKNHRFYNFLPLFSCSIQRKKLLLHTVIAMCNPLIQGGAKVCQYPKRDRS